MTGTDLVYGACLLLGLGALGWAVARARRNVALWMAAGLGVAALLLALALGNDGFDRMRLACYAVFLYAPVSLVLVGIALWGFRRWLSALAWVCAAALVAVGVDAFIIEPHALDVARVRVSSNKLSEPLRIVVLADIQSDGVGAYERMALARAAEQKPDLVLFAGDYVQVEQARRRSTFEALRNAIRESGLHARLGMYAVQGNIDPPGWEQVFEGLPIHVFADTEALATGPIRITGLSMKDSFNPELAVAGVAQFHVVLGHAPDFALGSVDADLLVAGHTHGGQVRLFGTPLITFSAVPRSWASGLTRLGAGRTLAVSRGIGMERRNAPRLRFQCRPELLTIDVTSSKENAIE